MESKIIKTLINHKGFMDTLKISDINENSVLEYNVESLKYLNKDNTLDFIIEMDKPIILVSSSLYNEVIKNEYFEDSYIILLKETFSFRVGD